MAKRELKNIFLSASIPLPERDPKYSATADIIAIRDSIIALATAVLPRNRLVWGGHPSITPLINFVLTRLKLNIQQHVTLYQSRFFESNFPEDNNKFENVILTDSLKTKEESLKLMRKTMLTSCEFNAGVFIGGMEGVEEEYQMFKETNPKALVLPLVSTGAAARIIYDNFFQDSQNLCLEKDYAYMSLFQKHLLDKI